MARRRDKIDRAIESAIAKIDLYEIAKEDLLLHEHLRKFVQEVLRYRDPA